MTIGTLGARVRVLGSTGVGQKVLLGTSGAVWLGFLVLHLYSNLHVFLGRTSTNTYYEALEASTGQLWGVRAVLLVAFATHVAAAYAVSRSNLSARPVGYRSMRPLVSGYAARTMRWTGPIVLAYVVYHLLQLTIGVAMPAGTTRDPHDVYGNIVASFSSAPVALVYVVSSLALSVHVWHGAASALQSLGIGDVRTQRLPRAIVSATSALMIAGFVSIPLAVQLGWLGR